MQKGVRIESSILSQVLQKLLEIIGRSEVYRKCQGKNKCVTKLDKPE